MTELLRPSPHYKHVALRRDVATLFGYQLPYLPDFLADHTLLGETLVQRIDEFQQRWVELIGWLWKWQNACFAWRGVADPITGALQLALVGRVRHDPAKAAMAVEVAQDVERLLAAFGLPMEPLNSEGLRRFLQPFEAPYLAEVHQHEELLTFHLMAKDAQGAAPQGYVVYPLEGPSGTLLNAYETMLRQAQPVAVSLLLEPTRLLLDATLNERATLEMAATRAETLKERQLMGDYLPQDLRGLRMADPHLALAARVYASLTRRLVKPFVTLIQVASPELTAAVTVAHAFANAAAPQLDERVPATERLPSGADVVSPAFDDAAGLQAARFSFEHLMHQPWPPTLAAQSPGMERLRYLTDARGAAAFWRLPINVRGGVPGIGVRQPPPDFEPGPRPAQLAEDEVMVGRLRRGGVATATLQDFTRHTLITGFTGSGKTNTVLSLLRQLWLRHRVPFLVLEAAKKEYRSLVRVPGFEDLLVFTLGDETTAPFRLNPFELLPGVRVEAHLGRLQACFDAALPQFGILPSIIAEALEEIYRTKGWRLADRAPQQVAASAGRRLFPTLRDLFDSVVRIAEHRGYSGEMRDNIRAAAAGRIRNLLIGSRGRMLGARRSFPAEQLFTRPVILELNDLNEDDKALTMMFLLMWLREYRELNPQRRLQHLTVVEEAHNVVSNVSSVGNVEVAADTKARAVAAFANMLAEVRAYGEGIVISDQSPEKLAPDAMRNTNLHIAHQLRDHNDREAIARAMIMDGDQQDYLGKLRTGEAAFFRAGMEKATFVHVTEVKDTAGFDTPPTDAEIVERMRGFLDQQATLALPFDGCHLCRAPCLHRESIEPQALDKDLHAQLLQALKRFDHQPAREHWSQHWNAIQAVCREAAARAGLPHSLEAAYCFLAHSLDFPFTEHMRRAFEQAFAAAAKA